MSMDLYFLLDASGSMAGREQEVVNHFNEYLNKHKNMPEETYLSLATFEGNNFSWIYQWKPINAVPPLTVENYVTGGVTPLNDSVAKVLDVAEKNADTGKLVIIITDGFENASKDYPGAGNPKLKARIAALDDKQWGILYLGEGMSASQVQAGGDSLSLHARNRAPVQGMTQAFDVAELATATFLRNRKEGKAHDNLAVEAEDEKDASQQ